VTLRDVSGFHRWVEAESPSAQAWSAVRTFLAQIGDRPWAAPSVPVQETSNQPEYEIRTVILEVEDGVEVQAWWLHEYATGAVDIVGVTFR
jgi:hypothetical protein